MRTSYHQTPSRAAANCHALFTLSRVRSQRQQLHQIYDVVGVRYSKTDNRRLCVHKNRWRETVHHCRTYIALIRLPKFIAWLCELYAQCPIFTSQKCQTKVQTKPGYLAAVLSSCVRFVQLHPRLLTTRGRHFLTRHVAMALPWVTCQTWLFLDACLLPEFLEKHYIILSFVK